jgi:PAS domain S-box-containing protein
MAGTYPAAMPDRVAATLLTTHSDAILAADPTGIIRFWNPGAERIFGHPADAAIGQTLDIIIPEKLRARHWEGWTRAIQSGHSHYGPENILSVPAITADGRRISVEFTIALMREENGQVTGIVAVLRDVSARFEQLRELRRQAKAK